MSDIIAFEFKFRTVRQWLTTPPTITMNDKNRQDKVEEEEEPDPPRNFTAKRLCKRCRDISGRLCRFVEVAIHIYKFRFTNTCDT